MRPALTGEMPAVHESVAWTWRVAPSLMDHVHGGVSAAYPPWGTTPPVADTAADFAVQFVDDVLKIEPPRHTHVCVTAGLSDRLLVLSVALALGPDDTTAGITVGRPPPPGMRPSPVYEGCYRLPCSWRTSRQRSRTPGCPDPVSYGLMSRLPTVRNGSR
ncbi:hypothetical protein [Streptomyces sp. NPDC059753]|uniref:hypothetical protein n=1 Tax=Streptomyces sp. NPDC059753 TaxID=3346933 RepID=UPI0036596956